MSQADTALDHPLSGNGMYKPGDNGSPVVQASAVKVFKREPQSR